jgi:transcriptional regulator with XRE-family HTH domain
MFLDVLNKLINEKGITKNKMLTDLHLGKNSFINWSERGTIPNGETLTKIASYFGVTVDHLLANPEINKSPSAKTESDKKDAIKEINELLINRPIEEQDRALQVLKAMLAERNQRNDK